MALLKTFLLLLISVCFINVNSYEYVPVYMWETSKNYSPLPSLGRINEEFFRDILLDKLNKDKTVLVFIEENLSPEDFTTYDSAGNSVFYSLSHMKSDAQVHYYPFVEGPLKALKHLPGVKVSNVQVTSDGLPPNTNAEPGELLIIDLNDAKENEDRSHMLSRHDSLIASIYKSFASKKKNIITLYTARHSSWLVPSELEENVSSRKARHLLEDSAPAPPKNSDKDRVLIKSSNVILYGKPLPFITKNNQNTTLTTCEEPSETTDAAGNITILTVTCGETPLSFYFKEDGGYWSLDNVTFDSSNITRLNVFAPMNVSYHSTKMQFSNDDVTLTWPNFQVELTKNARFSRSYDSTGYMTAPIWSGLFVTFILASILTFGLCMILDIKTMDRFDDPKGKTISINVVD